MPTANAAADPQGEDPAPGNKRTRVGGVAVTRATTLLASLMRLGRSLRDEKSDVFKFCGVMTFRDVEGGDVLKQRHVDAEIIVPRPADNVLSHWKKSKLPIVAGESGAGKTVASIRAGREGTVIYLRGSCVSDKAFELQSIADRAERTKRIVDLITSNVLSALPSKAWPTTHCDEVVTLVIDELGGCSNFIRGLCAARSEVRARVKQLLKVDAVYVIAVGTGTDVVDTSVGSEPATYSIVFLRSGEVWAGLTAAIDADFHAALATDGDAAASMLRAVVGNSRAAAVLAMALKPIQTAANSTVATYRAMLPALLTKVTIGYKALNALAELNECACAVAALQALALVMSRTHAPMDDCLRRQLLHRYGIVTDDAKYVEKGETMPDGCVAIGGEEVTERGRTFILVAPAGGRYSMSAAQVAFARLRYGVGSRPITGEGFDELIQDYIIASLFASHTSGFARDRVPTTAMTPTSAVAADDAMPTGWADATSLLELLLAHRNATGKPQAVSPFDVRLKVEPGFDASGIAAEVQELLLQLDAVVANNLAKGHYADILFFLRQLLLLFQIKKLDRTLLAYDAAAELYKMGCRQPVSVLGYLVRQVQQGAVSCTFGPRYRDGIYCTTQKAATDSSTGKEDSSDHAAATETAVAGTGAGGDGNPLATDVGGLTVQRAKLFRDLVANDWSSSPGALHSTQVREAQWPCDVTASLEELARMSSRPTGSATATPSQPAVRRVIIVAGSRPEALPLVMHGLATFIYIPQSQYDRALFPFVVPSSSISKPPALR